MDNVNSGFRKGTTQHKDWEKLEGGGRRQFLGGRPSSPALVSKNPSPLQQKQSCPPHVGHVDDGERWVPSSHPLQEGRVGGRGAGYPDGKVLHGGRCGVDGVDGVAGGRGAGCPAGATQSGGRCVGDGADGVGDRLGKALGGDFQFERWVRPDDGKVGVGPKFERWIGPEYGGGAL
eukprot:CAMPEP_0174252018 /NCGR_PEP_ID=MMETSP0439-20130205/1668_1 /TAXON_ID=0 /ORGANISM="Stereomyxa ramosa, Strain Chinc5" /LENGTH=175 /DNA_ID=CAMNT_0015332493 /DNA_START=177 /DNA_END=701 /DNA_ORIENTATION=+